MKSAILYITQRNVLRVSIVFIISLLAFTLNAQTRLQSATGNTGAVIANSFSVTLGSAPQYGNTLIAVISGRTDIPNNVSSITQDGVAWQRAVQVDSDHGNVYAEIWYSTSINTSASNTIVINTSSSARAAAMVMEYAGLLYASPVDRTAFEQGTPGSWVRTGTTEITTFSSELWIAAFGLSSSGYTISGIENQFQVIDNPVFSTNATTTNNAMLYVLERKVTQIGYAGTKADISRPSVAVGAVATFRRLITTFTPAFICDNPRTVTITGEGFTGATAVHFNGISASSFTVDSNTQITATVHNAATSGLISVTTSLGVGYSDKPLIIRKQNVPTATTSNTTCPAATDGALTLTNIPIALNFNSTQSQQVDLGAPLLSGLAAFTIEGWIKTTSYNRNSFFGQDDAIEFGFTSGGAIELRSGGLSTSLITSTVYPTDGDWHHVAGVGNGQNMSIYVDGVLVATHRHNNTTNYGTSNFNARIGAFVWNTSTPNYFNGQMLKVGFWNRALTSQEIVEKASIRYQYSGSETGLIAGYNFFEGAGITLSRLPVGGDGTISGSPASTWTDISTYSWTKQGGGFSATTKNISGIGVGTYDVTVNIGNCTSNTNSFVVGSNGTESSIAGISISGNSPVCTGTEVTLSLAGVTGASLGTNAQWKWYSGSCGGTEVGTGTSINVTPTATTTYYARAEGTCNTTACVSFTVVVNAAGTWLGTTSTDWNTASNWCGGVPTLLSDVIIPTSPIGNRFPVVGAVGAVCKTLTIETSASVTMDGAYTFDIHGNFTNNGTFTPSTSTVAFKASGTVAGASTTTFHNLTIDASQTLTASTGTMNITGHWTNNGTFSNNGGTVAFNGSAAQNINGVTIFNNLTINNAAGVVGKSNLTVNGVLNLESDSPDETKGSLEMTVNYGSYSNILTETANLTTTWTQAHDILNSNILYMGANATTIGGGDVTGKVKRTTINENVEYSFGNPNSTITFNGNGDVKFPTEILFVITKGANRGIHANKTNTVARLYQVIRTGGDSPTSFTLKLHYKDSELNGNTEGNLVLWDHHIPYSNANTPHEHGKTSQNTTDNWVELSGHGIGYLDGQEIVGGRTKYWMISDKVSADNVCTWLGHSTIWNEASNWTCGKIPTCSEDVIINNTTYSPVIPSTGANAKTIEIVPGATLVGSDGVLTICGGIATNGGKSSWTNNGSFDKGTSTVIFNYQRNTNNETSTISGSANFYNMEVSTGTILVLQAGSSTTVSNTVTQTGSIDARTFNNTFIYNGGSAQTVVNPAIGNGYHNLTLSGNGTKTLPTSNVNIAGNLVLDATLITTSNTITFDGITPQTLSGSSSSALNSVTINNGNGLTLDKNQKVDGTLTFTSGLITTGNNVLTLGCVASTLVQSALSYVNGILARDFCGIGTKLFPIGKGGAYRPLNIERTTGASGLTTIQSEQFEETIKGVLPANTTAFANRYWTITQPEGSQSYKIQFDGTDFSPNGTAVILKGDGNTLSTLSSLAATSPNYTTTNAISSFGDFTLGSECPVPIINAHPESTVVCEGSDVAYFAVNPNDPPPGVGESTYTYQWQASSTGESGDFVNLSNGTLYSDVNTNQLSVNNPTFALDGYAYRVVLTNFCGAQNTSSAATLTVNPQPQGSLSGQTNICKGSVGSLTWTATQGTGSFDITYKIGESGTPILLENVASGVSFEVGAITVNTTFNLISVKELSTNCTRTTGFTQGSAEITVNPYITWIGGAGETDQTKRDWFTASNWCGGVPTLTDDVIIPNVPYKPIIDDAGAVTKSMIIENLSSVTIDGAHTLQMAGSLTNNGSLFLGIGVLDINTGTSFIENNGLIETKNTSATPIPNTGAYGGTIKYSGTEEQTLFGGTFKDIIVENAAGVVLATDAIVNAGGTLEVKAGSKIDIGTGSSIIANKVMNSAGTSGIILRADATKPNGSLIFNNTIEEPVQATVQMYSPAYWTGTTTKTYFWQFMGIPIKNLNNVTPTMDGAFVRRYNEAGAGTASSIPLLQRRWIQLQNGNSMTAVTGYELVQAATKTYTFAGELFHADIDTTLSYTSARDASIVNTPAGQYPGQHILSNPYSSAIRISDIVFGQNTEEAVYIYNTGSFDQWNANKSNTGVSNSAGQYIVAPRIPSGEAGVPSEIPSMQGFLVRTNTTQDGSIYINYNKTKKPNTTKQRAPKALSWLKLNVRGTSGAGDVAWLFSSNETTNDYDNGWDGRKMADLGGVALLYSRMGSINYQINALPDVHGVEFRFRANNSDTKYTFNFEHANMMSQYNELYFYDRTTGVVIDISVSGVEYQFDASNQVPENRFMVLTSRPSTTGSSLLGESSNAIKVFNADKYIFVDNKSNADCKVDLYDISGQLLYSYQSQSNSLNKINIALIPGTYLVKLSGNHLSENHKVIIK